MRSGSSLIAEPPAVWLLAGTRPEAVKIAPLVREMRARARTRPLIVASGQHPTAVSEALECFGLRPQIESPLGRAGGGLAELAGGMLVALDRWLAQSPPAAVVVHGDTSTALAGALAAFWRRIPVVHLEAGLRTGDLNRPFPEEANRRLVAQVSALHLAPTPRAAEALRAEGVPGVVEVVGNTVVDAVRMLAPACPEPAGSAPTALLTMHRRESWGAPMRDALGGVRLLLDEYPDLTVVFPAHPNPGLRADIAAVLGDEPRVRLLPPLPYPELLRALRRATVVLTDSGGLVEEAVTLGKPVIVLRDVTERPEAVDAGYARLAGTATETVYSIAAAALSRSGRPRSGRNPFGDGFAAARAEAAIARLLGLSASEN